MKKSISSSSFAFLLSCGMLHAGTPVYEQFEPGPVPQSEGWWFRAAPYAWLTAIEGDIGIGNLSAPIDISMSDVLEDLDLAAMGVLELGYGKWSLGVDLIFAKTSQDIGAGGRLFESFRYEQDQWIITPVVAYRAIETDSYHMDVYAGARFTIVDVELTGRFARGGEATRGADTSWGDPIIGIRGRAEIGERFSFRYAGDIGGFGAGSDFAWQAFAGFGYDFSECSGVILGYRGLGIDYSEDALSLETVTHGPVLGLEFRF